jgi:hypothetical protein
MFTLLHFIDMFSRYVDGIDYSSFRRPFRLRSAACAFACGYAVTRRRDKREKGIEAFVGGP